MIMHLNKAIVRGPASESHRTPTDSNKHKHDHWSINCCFLTYVFCYPVRVKPKTI